MGSAVFLLSSGADGLQKLIREYNLCMKITSPIGPFSVKTLFSLSYYGSTHTRDCTIANIMLDPSNMYPESFHPFRISKSKDFRHKAKVYSRTRRPTRYLLIDFGLSRQYDPAAGPPLDQPLQGGDKSAPEHQDGKTPCNPFPTDVYYLGNLVRQDYIKVCVPNPSKKRLPDLEPRNAKGSSL